MDDEDHVAQNSGTRQEAEAIAGGQSLADLFAEWDVEDGTNDPVEIVRRNEEVDEFKRAMNENRLAMEGLGSRKLFP